jgi:hypothetical protein
MSRFILRIPSILTFRDSLNLSTVVVDVTGAEDEEQRLAFRNAIDAVDDPDKDCSEINVEVRNPPPPRSDTDEVSLEGIRRRMSLLIKENAKEKKNSASNQPPIERQQVDLEEANQSEKADSNAFVSKDEEGDKQFDLEQEKLDQKKKWYVWVYFITFTGLYVALNVAAGLLEVMDRPIAMFFGVGFNFLVLVYCIVVKVWFKLKGIEYVLLAMQAFLAINFFRVGDILNHKSPEE